VGTTGHFWRFLLCHIAQFPVNLFYSFEIFSEDTENTSCTHRIYLSLIVFLAHPSQRVLKKNNLKHSKKKLESEVEEYAVDYG